MVTEYVKNKSGYCYKVNGNKKTRISKDEYVSKTKTKSGGQNSAKRSVANKSIHSSNRKEKHSISDCKAKCDNDEYSNLKKKMMCVDNCRSKQTQNRSVNKSPDRLPTPTSMFSSRKIYYM